MSTVDCDLNKTGQLIVIAAGFFATVALLFIRASGDFFTAKPILTFFIALACLVRYWWVVLLLEWPFRIVRCCLLVLVWCALSFAAANVGDENRWIIGLIGLTSIGALTEIYNFCTGQWKTGPEVLTHSLKRAHIQGAASAVLVTVILIVCARSPLRELSTAIVGSFTVADWLRLVLMIRRHRGLLAMRKLLV